MTELIKMLVSQCKAEDDSYICNYERNFTKSNSKILPANAGPGVHTAMWQLFLALIVQIVLMLFTIGTKVPSGLLIPSMSIGAIAGRMLGITVEQLALYFFLIFNSYHNQLSILFLLVIIQHFFYFKMNAAKLMKIVLLLDYMLLLAHVLFLVEQLK
jgi:H+/Cl- antiporter ClcA